MKDDSNKMPYIRIQRKIWKRVLYDDEEGKCHDCGAEAGQYHNFGCDMETCPRCRGQLISCDCEDHYLVNRVDFQYDNIVENPDEESINYYIDEIVKNADRYFGEIQDAMVSIYGIDKQLFTEPDRSMRFVYRIMKRVRQGQKPLLKKIEKLEKKLSGREEYVAELVKENANLKKENATLNKNVKKLLQRGFIHFDNFVTTKHD